MPKNFFFISGNDHYQIKTYAEEIVKTYQKKKSYSLLEHKPDLDTHDYELISSFINDCVSTSFFGDGEIVTLIGIEYQKNKKVDEKLSLISQYLQQGFEENKIIVLAGVNLQKHSQLKKACSEFAEYKILNKLDLMQKDWRQKLQTIIKTKAQALELKIDGDCLNYLIEYFGENTSIIDRELEKLKLLSFSTPLSLSVVKELCYGKNDILFWDLANALQNKEKNSALKIVQSLLKQKTNLQSLISSLLTNISNRFKLILEAKVVAKKLKIKPMSYFPNDALTQKQKEELSHLSWTKQSKFYSQKILQSSFKFPTEKLIYILKRIEKTYLEVIKAKYDKKIALERLIIDILD